MQFVTISDLFPGFHSDYKKMNFMRHHSFYVSAEEKVFRSVAVGKIASNSSPGTVCSLLIVQGRTLVHLGIGMSFNFSDLDDKISTISMPVVNLK